MEKIDFLELSKYTTQARNKKSYIVLHWTGGDYNTVHNSYHVNITGNGDIYIDGSLADRREHCANRNTASIGITICCMDGAVVDTDGNIIRRGLYPVTPTQFEMMAKVTAKIAVEVGIPVHEIYTHAEIANRDGYGIKSGDDDIRWDLINLGTEVRNRINWYINKWSNTNISN